IGIISLVILCAGGYWVSRRIQPSPKQKMLFQGVEYIRDVRSSPRPMVIHIITVDLQVKGTRIQITPGDPDAELPLEARTTSEFLDDFGVQVAINGDGFTPWHSRGFFDYYPHSGDRVDVIGFAASEGVVYSQETDREPRLYFSPIHRARFNYPIGGEHNVISGNLMLVKNGKARRELDDSPDPRTAVALDQSNHRLMLLVIDGRQPGYSEGATLNELAEIIISHGGYTAMNLDGGGSSTMVVESNLGNANILNSPINNRIPGRERPIGNHLGIYAKPLP
ncbi:MAG: phosphodiester glycosidase family protein, partial [Chloroflexota bacterium]|nr:phosphodiester glycosidase family protein [Chloroflexota bacterium]